MKIPIFVPLDRPPTLAHCSGPRAVRIDATLGATSLLLSGGDLSARSICGDSAEVPDALDQELPVAMLRAVASGSDQSWFLISQSQQLHINGKSPLALAALEPGDIVSIGDSDWWLAQLYSPTPIEAPATLAGKLCPVCGGDLAMPGIRIILCCCGRALHCEAPDDPANKQALNCFFEAATCGQCGQPCTLEARLIPESPAKLFDALPEDFDTE